MLYCELLFKGLKKKEVLQIQQVVSLDGNDVKYFVFDVAI